MWKILVSAALILPLTVKAQPHFELGLTGGFSAATTFKAVNENPYIQKTSISHREVYGYNGAAKGLVDFRVCQLGIGLETGTLKANALRTIGFKDDIETNYMYHFTVYTGVELEGQKLAAPYMTPNVFINFKVNFSNNVYLYLGPMGGRMFSNNDLSWNGKSAGWLTGGNLGVVIKLSDRISINIAEGWRMVWMRGENINLDFENRKYWYNSDIIIPQPPEQTHVVLSVNSYNMSYANSAIGIRFRL